jgi:hypothetical protein
MSYPWPWLSQLEGGSGRNNCFEASFGAYLMAARLLDWELSQHALLNRVSVAARGAPDQVWNAETRWDQARAGVAAFGLPCVYTEDWAAVVAAAWSVVLVDGAVVTRRDGTAPYSADWFAGEAGPDHFVLWGPAFAGGYDWVMNPLDPAGGWARYELASLQAGFGGALILPPIADPAAGLYVPVARSGLLLQAPAEDARSAVGPDHRPVQLALGTQLRPAGQPWSGGYCRFLVRGSPAWGYYPVGWVKWGLG